MASKDLLKCAKYILLAVNLLFWMLSLAVLCLTAKLRWQVNGALILTADTSLAGAFAETYSSTLQMVMVAVSCLLIPLGILGCWGTVQGRTAILVVYGGGLLLMLCVEVATGIWNLHHKVSFTDQDVLSLQTKMQLYGQDNHTSYTQAWDVFQQQHKCCGVSDFTDWLEGPGLPWPPDSCCLRLMPGCGRLASQHDLMRVFQQGCQPTLLRLLQGCDPLHTLRLLDVSVSVAQIMAMVAALLFLWLLQLPKPPGRPTTARLPRHSSRRTAPGLHAGPRRGHRHRPVKEFDSPQWIRMTQNKDNQNGTQPMMEFTEPPVAPVDTEQVESSRD
ncbi:LOW QUALITY PROTEIN: tetraspanin-12 [Lethenteron reissneri]|uniref:LOW QUALITY PROTEIN: tetraspanin-12 n=1 Tax=Lethenteron reissneri TaxID=7753 RepID=UPI002AB7BF72|nr:LOW QUALITY PROTEIN: tetraspanin-12 [Lethenteron reissneri]